MHRDLPFVDAFNHLDRGANIYRQQHPRGTFGNFRPEEHHDLEAGELRAVSPNDPLPNPIFCHRVKADGDRIITAFLRFRPGTGGKDRLLIFDAYRRRPEIQARVLDKSQPVSHVISTPLPPLPPHIATFSPLRSHSV